MPFDKVVSPSFDDAPVPFPKACQDLFDYRGGKHKPVGLVLVKGISKLMMACAAQKRYADIQVVACTDHFNEKPAVQFNSATYLLPTGQILVLFRGTDDTLTGWKEDFDILAYDEGVPSQQYGIDYLEEVAGRYDGDIIISGHSKGGFVAQYVAMHSRKEIRDRVIAVYNNDGPGLANYDYLDSGVYEEMKDRYHHLIPESSLIGIMLAHDDDYTKVIKSNRLTGPMQHDMLTWQFSGDKLVTVSEPSKACKIGDLVFYDIRTNYSKEQISTCEKALGAVLAGIGQRGLLDVKAHPVASLKGGKKAWKAIDKADKAILKATMKDAKKSFKTAKKTVKSGGFRTVAERRGQ